MGEVLGLGMTHHPGLAMKGDMTGLLKAVLKDPALPERYRTPESWPEPMRQEWGDDEGHKASERHREALGTNFRKLRGILDAFAPDFVLIWEGDQYENFKEDIIAPFCLLAYDSIEVQPWAPELVRGRPNIWDEPKDKAFVIKGQPHAGKYLASRLLEAGFDVAYAYRPLHQAIGHAFLYPFLYLDYDRTGWDYPVVPFHVNYCGSRVIAQRGIRGNNIAASLTEAELDPPSPMPWRCFDLGAATARILAQSPWRVALLAATSWSQANLTPKHSYLYPDVAADREMYEALRAGDYDKWRNTPLTTLEERGQPKLLTWMCLVGAMAELGRRPDEIHLVEGWLFNSTKVFAVFRP